MTALALVACAPERVARPPAPPVDWASLTAPAPSPAPIAATAKERTTAGLYVAALEAPDQAGLGAVLDDDAHFAFAGFEDVHGRDNAVRAHGALFAELEPRSFAARRVLLTGQSQLIEWTLAGMQRGSEKPVALRGASLLETRDDGTIADIHVYFDQAVLRAELTGNPKSLASLPPPALPAGPPEIFEQGGSAEERSNVLSVRSVLEALEAKRESVYVGSVSDDFALETLEARTALYGRAGARAYFEGIHRTIDRLDISIDNIWGSGPFVAVEYDLVGEQTGPLGVSPAQPKALVKLYVLDVVELLGGKIRHVVRYDNPSPILTVAP